MLVWLGYIKLAFNLEMMLIYLLAFYKDKDPEATREKKEDGHHGIESGEGHFTCRQKIALVVLFYLQLTHTGNTMALIFLVEYYGIKTVCSHITK